MAKAKVWLGFMEHWNTNCLWYQETDGLITTVCDIKWTCGGPFKWQTSKQRTLVQLDKVFYVSIAFKQKPFDKCAFSGGEILKPAAEIYTVRSKSSRTEAIKTKKRRRVFFPVYLFKVGSIRCNTQVSTCFLLLHGLRKVFCRNLV